MSDYIAIPAGEDVFAYAEEPQGITLEYVALVLDPLWEEMCVRWPDSVPRFNMPEVSPEELVRLQEELSIREKASDVVNGLARFATILPEFRVRTYRVHGYQEMSIIRLLPRQMGRFKQGSQHVMRVVSISGRPYGFVDNPHADDSPF
jgi:hypothetical protein